MLFLTRLDPKKLKCRKCVQVFAKLYLPDSGRNVVLDRFKVKCEGREVHRMSERFSEIKTDIKKKC